MPSHLNSNTSSWKQEVNRRVAEHRNRKGPVRVEAQQTVQKPASSRAAEVAARVSARYAKAPSYNAALAEDARAAVRAAEAASRAAAQAQAEAENVLASLEAAAAREEAEQAEQVQRCALEVEVAPTPAPVATTAQPGEYAIRWSDELPQPHRPAAAQAETAEQAPELVPHDWRGSARQPSVLETPAIEIVDGGQPIPGNVIQFPREIVAPRKARSHHHDDEAQLSIFEVDPGEMAQLIDEPVAAHPEPEAYAQPQAESAYAAYTEPAYAEPAYAEMQYAEPAYSAEAAMAYPAYAEPETPTVAPASVEEQPLYEEYGYERPAPRRSIWGDTAYETPAAAEPLADAAVAVEEAATAGTYADVFTPRWREPEAQVVETVAPARPARQRTPNGKAKRAARAVRMPELDLAPYSNRLLASVVNLTLISTGVVLAGYTAARFNAPFASLQSLGIGAVVATVVIGFFYTAFFYLLSDSTPGMRYARLRLVAFSGRRATRAERLARFASMLLSALPAGLGFFWMHFDREGLSWHDRLSGTYLRRY